MPRLERFGKVYFWEFLQNFPLLLGFLLALEQSNQKNWLFMFLFCFFGSVFGSFAIRYTEPKITSGKLEPLSVTLTNLVSFSLIAGIVAIYFSQGWGNWMTDCLIGFGLGIVVGYGQDLAEGKKKPGVRHILALSIAFIFALIAIRYVAQVFLPVWGGIILTAVVTLVIVMIDY